MSNQKFFGTTNIERWPFAITKMRFPGVRLVEQTEQKFRRIRRFRRKTKKECRNSRALLF